MKTDYRTLSDSEILHHITGCHEKAVQYVGKLASCEIASVDELFSHLTPERKELAEAATKEYNRRYPEPVGKPKTPNYKQALIGLLGLRSWATKEDIVSELSELL